MSESPDAPYVHRGTEFDILDPPVLHPLRFSEEILHFFSLITKKSSVCLTNLTIMIIVGKFRVKTKTVSVMREWTLND